MVAGWSTADSGADVPPQAVSTAAATLSANSRQGDAARHPSVVRSVVGRRPGIPNRLPIVDFRPVAISLVGAMPTAARPPESAFGPHPTPVCGLPPKARRQARPRSRDGGVVLEEVDAVAGGVVDGDLARLGGTAVDGGPAG